MLDEGEANAGCTGVGDDDRAQRRIEVFDDGGGGEEVFEGVEFVVVIGGTNPGYLLVEQDAKLGAGHHQVG